MYTLLRFLFLVSGIYGHNGLETRGPFLLKSAAMTFIPEYQILQKSFACESQTRETCCEQLEEGSVLGETNCEFYCTNWWIGNRWWTSAYLCPAHYRFRCPDNPCNNRPCENGGTCYYTTCLCRIGYYGTRCQHVDSCLGAPCQNGGTCMRLRSSYTCSCAPGYYDQNCQYVDACYEAQCENGGTCTRNNSTFNCSCVDGFAGATCQQDCIPGPAHIVMILDASLSADKHFNDSKGYAAPFIEGLQIGTDEFQIAVITYSTEAHLEISFKQFTNKTALLSAIDKISPRNGSSYLNKALEMVFGHQSVYGARLQVDKYVLVISDGLSTLRTESISAASILRSQRVKIAAVGIGTQVAQEELLQIAYNDSYVFSARNDDALNAILMGTADPACSGCSLNTASDVMLLVDVSTNQNQLRKTLEGVKYLIHEARTYNPDIYIGMVTFDKSIESKFTLTQFNETSMIIMQSQTGLVTTNKRSNITAVLRFVHENSFTSGRNSRKFVVVFSNEGWTDVDSIISEREALNQSNITVAFVSIGSSADLDTAFSIAEKASDVYYVEDEGNLKRLRALISQTKYAECDLDTFAPDD